MTFDVSSLERKFDIALPADFRAILKFGDLSILNLEYYDESEDFLFRLTKWFHFNGTTGTDIKIDSFLKRGKLSEVWDRHREMWGSLQYLPFATTSDPPNGLILICTTSSNHGEVFYSQHGDRNPVFLEKNISIFLNSTEQIIREDKKQQFENLFIRSGENFWRIENTPRA